MPFKAVAFLLRKPELWHYLALPILFNLGIILLIYGVGYQRFFLPLVSSREGWSAALVALGLGLLFLVLGGLLFFILAGIMGAPFYDRMGERVEREAFRREPHHMAEPMSFWQSARHALWESLRRWGIAALCMAVLLLFNVVPVLGSFISSVLGLLAGGLFLTLDALSYPLDRRNYTLRDKLMFMRSRSTVSSGLAAGLLLLYAIPCAWLIAPPIAALAGTLLYCDLKRGDLQG